jgi:hypothetical protein
MKFGTMIQGLEKFSLGLVHHGRDMNPQFALLKPGKQIQVIGFIYFDNNAAPDSEDALSLYNCYRLDIAK